MMAKCEKDGEIKMTFLSDVYRKIQKIIQKTVQQNYRI